MDALPRQATLEDRKVAFCITDRDLRVIEVNDAACLLSACDDVVGRSLFDISPELIGQEQALADILAGKRTRLELVLTSRPDADRLMLVNLPYHNGTNAVAGLICVLHEVTDLSPDERDVNREGDELRLLRDALKRRTQQLAAARAELQNLDEIKSRFTAIAAHELRSPLTAISGYLELLIDNGANDFTDLQREYLDIIQTSTQRLLTITNDLLDLTRLEADRLELILKPLDLAELVRIVIAEHTPAIEAKGIHLTLSVADFLPAALCDEVRAAQVLSKLLSNAIKYTPPASGIEIRVERAAEEGFLQVAVRDNGVGIPAAEQPWIFERFYHASTAAVGAPGAGLGLPLARALVELHGGKLWLESAAGQGAVFYVTFPITDLSRGPERLKRPGHPHSNG